MGVFVTDGAERAVVIIFGQFGQGTVAVYLVLLAFVGDGDGVAVDTILTIFQVFAHPPLVRPNQIGARAVVHAVAGIDNEQLVDESVAVPVVKAPVDMAGTEHLHDVLHQILRVLIVSIRAGIFLSITWHLDVVQVKIQVEVAIALRIEIVVNRALEGCLGQVLRIEDFIPLCQGSFLVALEGPVVELHHDRQLMTLTMIEVAASLLGLPAGSTTT